jgi:hypothetical protein
MISRLFDEREKSEVAIANIDAEPLVRFVLRERSSSREP